MTLIADRALATKQFVFRATVQFAGIFVKLLGAAAFEHEGKVVILLDHLKHQNPKIVGATELSLNDDERIAVLAAVDPFGAYLVRWTLKEAFIKARGGRPNLPDISTAPSIAASPCRISRAT